MRVVSLRVDALRCLSNVELSPVAGLNVFLGTNGAGKTSILEALHLLGYGRSFRTHDHDAVIARGKSRLTVFAEIERFGALERVGLERGKSSWRALSNGEVLAELGELVRRMPVLAFAPESHSLVSGPSEGRRRFFDWLMFHVEPGFSAAARRYARCLRQRNAALKLDGGDFDPWTEQLVLAGEDLNSLRSRHFPNFAAHTATALSRFLPELGDIKLSFARGWRDDTTLAVRLAELRDRERDVGHTLAGPHRANWQILARAGELKDIGSRGQQKLVALAVVTAAAEIFREQTGHPPVILLDDVTSELDGEHQQRVLAHCASLGAQLWVTGTDRSPALEAWQGDVAWFHVEHGAVRRATA